ncbi:hypothetical protein AYI74_21840 [Shewanella algae]|nr:hypothetical protein AYI82_12005 [Shewanella algae]TVO80803.1 hypothetical protein AYI76_18690 [Shewanella algae]TVO80906.1 hypothetical protein AYI78_18390 [Shewanella algae]TVO91701.1 hypothetical protein AYI79_18310 [Shewanella algae]TWU59577.1 hypothetical protein AYI74_21840 [Shewanella algae]
MPLGDFRSVYMPYCLKKQPDGSYVVLNREYKPVGFNTRDHITYEDFPVSSKLKGIGPGTAKKLSYKDSDDTETIYLYNDGCVPVHSAENMKLYLKKLAILAKLEIKT